MKNLKKGFKISVWPFFNLFYIDIQKEIVSINVVKHEKIWCTRIYAVYI